MSLASPPHPVKCPTPSFVPAGGNALTERVIPLFPLKDIREFTANGLKFVTNSWRRILGEMEGLLHLQLTHLDTGPVLDALDFDRGGVYGEATKIRLKDSATRS